MAPVCKEHASAPVPSVTPLQGHLLHGAVAFIAGRIPFSGGHPRRAWWAGVGPVDGHPADCTPPLPSPLSLYLSPAPCCLQVCS